MATNYITWAVKFRFLLKYSISCFHSGSQSTEVHRRVRQMKVQDSQCSSSYSTGTKIFCWGSLWNYFHFQNYVLLKYILEINSLSACTTAEQALCLLYYIHSSESQSPMCKLQKSLLTDVQCAVLCILWRAKHVLTHTASHITFSNNRNK